MGAVPIANLDYGIKEIDHRSRKVARGLRNPRKGAASDQSFGTSARALERLRRLRRAALQCFLSAASVSAYRR
jgi:hypothetical protein